MSTSYLLLFGAILCIASAENSTTPISFRKSIVVDNVGKYFNYPGPLRIKGTVKLQFYKKYWVQINYMLSGVEKRCSSPGEADNSCGIHIHQGTSCKTDAGGHYYNKEMYTNSDPWTTVVYQANGKRALGKVDVRFGFSYADTGLPLKSIVFISLIP